MSSRAGSTSLHRIEKICGLQLSCNPLLESAASTAKRFAKTAHARRSSSVTLQPSAASKHVKQPVTLHKYQKRPSSHSPLATSSTPARKKVTIPTLNAMYKRSEPIATITAHDFPSSHVADEAGMDIVLVGDSLAMVAMGMDDTSEVTVEDMLLHCRGVSRGARAAFIVRELTTSSP